MWHKVQFFGMKKPEEPILVMKGMDTRRRIESIVAPVSEISQLMEIVFSLLFLLHLLLMT